MSITHRNLESIINLLAALSQRQEVLRQIASNLHSGTVWRSPDGSPAIPLSPDESKQLEDMFDKYLTESETIIATARGLLAAAP